MCCIVFVLFQRRQGKRKKKSTRLCFVGVQIMSQVTVIRNIMTMPLLFE